MSEVWCVTEISADDENPCIQNLRMTAYVDAFEAQQYLGSDSLRELEEDREGIKVGKAYITRYNIPVEELAGWDDQEISTIAGIISDSHSDKQRGLIVTRSIHVARKFRGQGICGRMLQEARRLHSGIAYHYGHSAVPQERASHGGDFAAMLEKLKTTYRNSGVDIEDCNLPQYPEIQVADWSHKAASLRGCAIEWAKVITQEYQTRKAA